MSKPRTAIMSKPLFFFATLAACILAGCSNPNPASSRAIDPVDFARVDIDDPFWSPRLERHREVTVPVCIAQIKDSTFRLQNFVEAARKLALAGSQAGENASGDAPESQQADQPQHRGYFFDDSDVYKALEGFAYSLQLHPDAELEALCDDWIAKFAAAQEPDGYINTYFTLKRPEDKWTDMDKHEMYCAGHLTEAAVAYYRATGKKTLLNVAEKMIAHIMSVFGPDKRHWVPGHEEIELALVKLYDVTGKTEYLDFAHWLLEQRGRGYGVWKNTKLKADHYQDLVPVSELTDVGGHAVRAMYLYSGMADVQSVKPDAGYVMALNRLWGDVVLRNMYITGGIGSTRVGEAFTRDYDLPNADAYCETCASIGMVFWNWRMNLLHGDAKYADVVERSLYNGVLVGINLAGDRFFYVNPLESDGTHHRKAWYGCACCPSNLCRFLPSLGGYIYGEAPGAIFVNLYIGSALSRKGRPLLAQSGNYPWDGDICLEFLRPCRDELHLRLPGWCRVFSISRNGAQMMPEVKDGYAVLPGPWKKGEKVELSLLMPVKMAAADPMVLADSGKRAVCRGPLVYCAEEVDNPAYDALELNQDSLLEPVTLTGGPLEGFTAIDWNGFRWIPYFAWDNRSPGHMKVWVDLQ